MPDEVLGHALAISQSNRRNGRSPVQSLDPDLLVDTEDHGVLRGGPDTGRGCFVPSRRRKDRANTLSGPAGEAAIRRLSRYFGTSVRKRRHLLAIGGADRCVRPWGFVVSCKRARVHVGDEAGDARATAHHANRGGICSQ